MTTTLEIDADTYAELATALIDWSNATSPNLMQDQQSLMGTHSVDFMNKQFNNVVVKSEPETSPCEGFSGSMNVQSFYPENVMIPSNNEQVPMDENDPLECFTFWDGETFYCNKDADACCKVSSNMAVDNEMTNIQDYLLDSCMIRDDLVQIEEADLMRNPTLAELNSCNDNTFDCSAESSFFSEDSGYLLSPEFLSKSMPLNESGFLNPTTSLMQSSGNMYVNSLNCSPSVTYVEPKSSSQSVLSSSCPATSRPMACPQYLNPCDERFLLCPQNSPASDSFIQRQEMFNVEPHLMNNQGSLRQFFSDKSVSNPVTLSTSAPSEVSTAVGSPIIKTESPSLPVRPKSTEKSLSGFSSLSLSNDDESGSYFDDSDHDVDDDFSSDEDLYQYDSDENFSTSWPPGGKSGKAQARRHRFFWQYNLQSRGSKSQNLMPLSEEHDPHVLNDVKDPVFSEDCSLPVKHSGKARKGDGNDLTPNPRKLFSIGLELKKLNKLIYNMNPVHDYGPHGKPLSRKEKNKLASRVCRLKKKAQHEANKIKLYGLQHEHKRLLAILIDLKRLIKYKVEHFEETSNMPCFKKLEDYLTLHEPFKAAGNTTEFVNEVLEKVSKGDADGGLGNM